MKDEADQILNALRAAGDKGLLIDELTTSLGIDSQTISQAMKKLKSKGLIKVQKQELEEERFVLKAGTVDDADQGSLSDMDGCPCFHCLRIGKCGVRQPDSPVSCRELEDWMIGSNV